MSQRYFLTAESTYEDLRQSLNAALSYPNALGKSVFQTALYAPRDAFRRVLLAVDTDLPGYATVSASIAPLLDSDAMEEIDEATYLAALATATAGASNSSSLTSGDDTLTLGGNGLATFSFDGTGGELTFVTSDDPAGDGQEAAIGVAVLASQYATLYLRSGDADAPVVIYGEENTLGQIECAAVKFGDDTTQTTAWTGSFSYNSLDDLPTLGTAAAADIGTGSTQVAAGDHTHTQLHDRSHAITSTSDHTATAWRLFYSNGSGAVTELTFGNSGQALISNGASAAPTFQGVQKTITSGTAAPTGGADGDIYLQYS